MEVTRQKATAMEQSAATDIATRRLQSCKRDPDDKMDQMVREGSAATSRVL